MHRLHDFPYPRPQACAVLLVHEQDDVFKLLWKAPECSMSLLPEKRTIHSHRQDAKDIHRSFALPMRQSRGWVLGPSARIALRDPTSRKPGV